MTRDEISLRAKSEGGMFAVIPAVVLKDEELSWSAKMLYGIITWKCNEHAYCWITNRGLGNEMGLSPKRISVLLSMLEERGHIETEIFRDEETGQVLHRHIYPIMKSSRGILGAEEMEHPIPENMDTPIHENRDRYPRPGEYPIPENGDEKYKIKIKKENTIAHLKNLCEILLSSPQRMLVQPIWLFCLPCRQTVMSAKAVCRFHPEATTPGIRGAWELLPQKTG